MDPAVNGLAIDPLGQLRQRQSSRWRADPADVLPRAVAEMTVTRPPPIAAVLPAAVQRSYTGYGHATPDLGRAVAGFAARRWDWDVDSTQVTAVTDGGGGVVELLRVLTRPGDCVAISP